LRTHTDNIVAICEHDQRMHRDMFQLKHTEQTPASNLRCAIRNSEVPNLHTFGIGVGLRGFTC
jgi:hypothetical protein